MSASARVFWRLWVVALRSTLIPGRDPRRLIPHAAIAAMALTAASVTSTIYLIGRNPIGGVGVELTVSLFGVSMLGSLLACVAEFATLDQSAVARWLRTMPVSPRSVAIISRAPFLTVGVCFIALLSPPLAAHIHATSGEGFVFAWFQALSTLVASLAIAPVLVVLVQRISNRVGLHTYYPGLLILAWSGWSALGGLVFRRILNDGAGATLDEPLTWIAFWPAIANTIFSGTSSSWIVAAMATAGSVVLAYYALRFTWITADLMVSAEIRHERHFRRAPLVQLGMTQLWRTRRSRAYVTAGATLAGAYAIVAARSPSARDAAENVAFVLAIFVGGMATVRRSIHGSIPREIRLLSSPHAWSTSVVYSNFALGVSVATVAMTPLAVVTGRHILLLTAFSMSCYAVGFGTFLGASLSPKPGDASMEFLASGVTMITLGLLGNVATRLLGEEAVGYVGCLLVAAAATSAASIRTENRRWFLTITQRRITTTNGYTC